MLVLGLESSCDETAASIVRDGTEVLSESVASQIEIHARYGGVVPEIASRAHVANVIPVLQDVLQQASLTLDDIDGIAVTQGPGLVGALLVAVQAAKAIAYATGKPLVGVHHLEGHMNAIYLEPDPPPMPHLALVVSGGHSSLILVDGHNKFQLLGATRDDAAGEAFDKVAKLLGLGYPGGPVVDRLAQQGDAHAIRFPRAMSKPETGLDMSFSGLKTAVLNHVRAEGVPEGDGLADLCASFQAAVVEQLVRKTVAAARLHRCEHVQVCGGVAANKGLRVGLEQAAQREEFRVYAPVIRHCTDNAAMIAAAGYFRLQGGESLGFELNARSNIALPGSA